MTALVVGEDLGTVAIGVARGRPEVTGTGQRIAAALAPHLAVVVHARHLAETLATYSRASW